MVRLAANISTLFPELPFLDRIDAAARAGFKAIECQFPYAVLPEQIAARLSAASVEWVLFNSPPGRAEAGERGLACLPGRDEDFADGIAQALRYCTASHCRQVHVMAGVVPAGTDGAQLQAQFITRIGYAADQLATIGATVLIEPINTRVDVPGYFLDGTAKAVNCIERAKRSNIRLQYDVYHMQIMEGDLLRTIERLLPYIGHIQVADNPGRHEPGTGEVNFPRLFDHIDSIGYRGYVGCEYIPTADTIVGLAWANDYLKGSTK
jgi:hydroxypyruvate isomerase